MKGYQIQEAFKKLPLPYRHYRGIYNISALPGKLPKNCFVIAHRKTSEFTGHWYNYTLTPMMTAIISQ